MEEAKKNHPQPPSKNRNPQSPQSAKIESRRKP